MSMAAVSHDSGEISLFDHSAGKTTRTLTHNQSGVSASLFANSGLNLISGGHDGSINLWDLRTNKVVQELRTAHSTKFEEGVMGLAVHHDIPFFASAGADSLVNIFELNLH